MKFFSTLSGRETERKVKRSQGEIVHRIIEAGTVLWVHGEDGNIFRQTLNRNIRKKKKREIR